MKKLLLILGPTATGKTDLALNLAKKLAGELIAVDSRQVYQGLNVITNKIPSNDQKFKAYRMRWKVDGVWIWLYDKVSLKVQYNVYDFLRDAVAVVDDIIGRNKLPILVGGTGFYIRAIYKGLPNLEVPINASLREELEKLTVNELQVKLKLLSPTVWEKLNQPDRKNPRRLLRSIELTLTNPYDRISNNLALDVKNYDLLKIGLTAPRSTLNDRINSRVFDWLNQGAVGEVQSLMKKGIPAARFKQLGLGYADILEYIEKKINYQELVNRLQSATRQYAKRQRTWFKKYEVDAEWFDISESRSLIEIENRVVNWYHSLDESQS